MSTLFLDAALSYARLGWPVLALYEPDGSGGCTCRKAACSSPGKHPRTPNGVKDATTEPETIRRWWRQWPEAGVGIATGPASGLYVLDIDPQRGGGAALASLVADYGQLPQTLQVQTGGGGRHLYYAAATNGIPLGNGVNIGGRAGLDVRGLGGYVVAPPSLHASGAAYRWQLRVGSDGLALASAPPWLYDQQLTVRGPRPLALSGPIREGARNETLYRLARVLRVKGMPPDVVFTAIDAVNAEHCDPPLSEAEVAKIAENAGAQPDRADFRPARLMDSFPAPKGAIGGGTNFLPRTAAEILSEEPESIRWVWEPFLPEGGLVVLTAYMKVGKSTLGYAIVMAVAQGRPLLGYPTKQGGVLVLAVEEHPRDVKARLRRFGMRPEDPIHVHAGGLDNSPATLLEIRNFIREKGVTLVVLDTLSRYWDIRDENDNAEIVRCVSPLLDVARETGATVVLVHHDRKSGGEEGRGIRGGSALLGLVDQSLSLERRQGGNQGQRVLRALGRYDDTPREVVLELVGDEYRRLSDDAEATVLAALTVQAQDVPTLSALTGLSDKVVREALGRLGARVLREGEGVKGKPYTYRRAPTDSFPAQPDFLEGGTNRAEEDRA